MELLTTFRATIDNSPSTEQTIELINQSDEDLLRLSAKGDDEAFTALYRRRQAGIFRFALNMTRSEAVAEEITQEVFLTLIRSIGVYDAARGTVAAFLYGIARNKVLRCAVPDNVSLEEQHSGVAAAIDNANPLLDLTNSEAIEALRSAIASLPAVYREVIALCDLEEVSYADAAQVLTVPVGTVRSRLSRARTLLLNKLRPKSLRCVV